MRGLYSLKEMQEHGPFGLLHVIAKGPNNKNGKYQWYCRCECGNLALKVTGELLIGRAYSCGCSMRAVGFKNRLLYPLPNGAKVDPSRLLPRPMLEIEPCYYGSEAV